jgi:hypothetical protein
MAELLRADGTRETITPKNGTDFQFKGEAYDLIGTDMIEIVPTHDGRILLIDENGKLKEKPINVAASRLYRFNEHAVIVGDAIVCNDSEVV